MISLSGFLRFLLPFSILFIPWRTQLSLSLSLALYFYSRLLPARRYAPELTHGPVGPCLMVPVTPDREARCNRD